MNQDDIALFRQTFTGEIVLPTDSAYATLQNVLLATGAPAIILRPKTTQDVVSSIKFVKDNALSLSVRSGGHSGAGFGTNVDGAVIDMSLINTIELVDEVSHRVRIGSGAKWSDVAIKLHDYNLAISSGDTKTVGVGGLTLGGGIGWLVRKVGLTIDSLISAEIVTADGRVLTASSTENTDLFWGIRGGGGNFGVVTHFEFTAQPIGKVFAGTIGYGITDLSSVLKGWRDTMRSAPEELNSMIVVFPSMGGNPAAIMIPVCYAGDDETVAMNAIEPLKKLGTVTMQTVQMKEYFEVLEDAHPPSGVHIIAKNVFVKEFSDKLIDTIVEMCKTNVPILQIRSLGGAMNRIDPMATAFPHRDSEILLVSPTFLPLDASQEVAEQAMKPWSVLSTFGSGTYANLLSTNTQEDVHVAYFGGTYEKLVELKKIYDPENVFHNNHNIKV